MQHKTIIHAITQFMFLKNLYDEYDTNIFYITCVIPFIILIYHAINKKSIAFLFDYGKFGKLINGLTSPFSTIKSDK